jgi:hypothetical protein
MPCFVLRSLQLFGLIAIVLLVGCGKRGPQTYRIPGRLVYEDNTPVPGASVVLQTKIDEQVIAARGMVSPDGKFELTTFTEGDGAVAGTHDVSITPIPQPDTGKPTQPTVASKYGDFTTAKLQTIVTPETKEIVITIERNPRS